MDMSDADFAHFVDRIMACRDAEDAAKEDTKLVYAEAADAGLDKTALGSFVRAERMDAKQVSKANRRDALIDEYRARYRRGKASHVRVREEDIPHDAETGEIIESNPPVASQPESDLTSSPSPLGQVAAIQPETANENTLVTTNGGSNESEDAHPVSVSDPGRRHDIERIDASAGGQTNEVATTSAQIVTGEGAHIASVTPIRPAKLYRPLCLNRDRCGASGPKECWKCLKAAEQGSAA